MKLHEVVKPKSAHSFFRAHRKLDQLDYDDQAIWRDFYLAYPAEATAVVKFLENANSDGDPLPKIAKIEQAREAFMEFAKATGIKLPNHTKLYRGSDLYDVPGALDDEDEVLISKGDKITYTQDRRVAYWTPDRQHALDFVDPDDPAALLSCDYDPNSVLFDLTVLPFPGGNMDHRREPELLLRPQNMKVSVEDIFTTERDKQRLEKIQTRSK